MRRKPHCARQAEGEHEKPGHTVCDAAVEIEIVLAEDSPDNIDVRKVCRDDQRRSGKSSLLLETGFTKDSAKKGVGQVVHCGVRRPAVARTDLVRPGSARIVRAETFSIRAYLS